MQTCYLHASWRWSKAPNICTYMLHPSFIIWVAWYLRHRKHEGQTSHQTDTDMRNVSYQARGKRKTWDLPAHRFKRCTASYQYYRYATHYCNIVWIKCNVLQTMVRNKCKSKRRSNTAVVIATDVVLLFVLLQIFLVDEESQLEVDTKDTHFVLIFFRRWQQVVLPFRLTMSMVGMINYLRQYIGHN